MHTTRLHWFFIILTVLIVSIFFIHYQPISTYNEKASESAKEITQAQKYKEGSFRYLKTRLPVLLPQMGIDSSITLIEDFFAFPEVARLYFAAPGFFAPRFHSPC